MNRYFLKRHTYENSNNYNLNHKKFDFVSIENIDIIPVIHSTIIERVHLTII